MYTGGNVYFNGAAPCDSERKAYVDTEHIVTLKLTEEEGSLVLKTDLYQYLPEQNNPVVSSALLGEAFEPEQRFEDPDGLPITFWQDYLDVRRGFAPLSGPFSCRDEVFQVWDL